jgi:hypothetical protein
VLSWLASDSAYNWRLHFTPILRLTMTLWKSADRVVP